MKKQSERGLLSLEACIAVVIFMFFMLFLYSFFSFFEARNEMAHVLLATANSLSLDTYETGKLEKSGNLSQLIYGAYKNFSPNNGFVNKDLWNEVLTKDVDEDTWDGSVYVSDSNGEELEQDDYGRSGVYSSTLGSTVRERFVAYLAGEDQAEAERLLKRYHIAGGLNGLDFSGTHIASGKLYITLTYKIELEFNAFGWGKMTMQQSVCSKLWK